MNNNYYFIPKVKIQSPILLPLANHSTMVFDDKSDLYYLIILTNHEGFNYKFNKNEIINIEEIFSKFFNNMPHIKLIKV